jgi:hypothetical protein
MSNSRPAVVASAWIFLVLGIASLGAGLALITSVSGSTWLLFPVALVLVAWATFLFVALNRDPSRRLSVSGRPGRVATTHTLEFTVGDREKHAVVYVFDQMWGWLTISVDQELILKKFITFSLSLRRVFEFQVGKDEPHTVRIEKVRPLLVAFARPQPTRAFCDGVLIAEEDGIS